MAALVTLAVWLAYRGSFAGPFVLDDTPAITDNYSIRHFATAWTPPPDTTVSGRPVVNLTLALNYAISGLEVRDYHVFNVAIHLLAALALFGVVRRTLRNPHLAPALARDATLLGGGVALLWAVHPLQTESVTYVIQRAESLMGLFYLLTLYAFIRGTNAETRIIARGWLVLSFAACLLGMATKEVMATAPVIVLLYDRTFVSGSFRTALRTRGRFYAALAATWPVLAALVISTANRSGTAGLGTKLSSLDYALSQGGAVGRYLRLVLWPSGLVFDYGRAVTTRWSTVVGPMTLVFALMAGTLFALRVRRAGAIPGRSMLGFLGAWFFAILAPSSSVVPIATQTVAEHRMYLPLAAVVTLFVIAAHRWLGRRGAGVAIVFAALGLATLTQQRNIVYRDALTLWADTAAKIPDNPRAITNLASALIERGRGPEALEVYAARLQRRPDDIESYINYGNALLAAGRADDAIAQLESALRLDPDNLEARNNLGITLAQSGRAAEAVAHFERAIQLKPASAESHRNLGLALTQAGRTEDALAQFAESVRLQPAAPFAHDAYGLALLKARRLPEATAEFEAALRIDPKLAPAHYHLGLALPQGGRIATGLSQLQQAVQLSPDDAEMHNALGLALAASDYLAEALRQFETAVQLRPDFAEAMRNRDRARAELTGQ